jgi:hypothetical protein
MTPSMTAVISVHLHDVVQTSVPTFPPSPTSTNISTHISPITYKYKKNRIGPGLFNSYIYTGYDLMVYRVYKKTPGNFQYYIITEMMARTWSFATRSASIMFRITVQSLFE